MKSQEELKAVQALVAVTIMMMSSLMQRVSSKHQVIVSDSLHSLQKIQIDLEKINGQNS